ncbi:MAG: class I SAM-dependent methyltransferase [Alphaproteobacteria bacterium]
MTRQISSREAAAFYDRLGRGLDTQRFYEDPAADDMVAHGDFGAARHVVDFGCGTGRLAERLLKSCLPRDARLLALDVSARMVEITAERLAPFGARARAVTTDGGMALPLEDGAADRVIATYVVDLLREEDARRFIAEAHRVLEPGGLLCLVSLTVGQGPVSRAVCGLWNFLHRINPVWTGGCRPVRLAPLLGPEWELRHHRTLVRFGVPSEIVVAGKRN